MKKEPILKFAAHHDSSELLELPLSMLMQTIFVGGNKGSGKTTALKRLYEAAHAAGAQCGAIAPLGRWWSLRIAKNGRDKGLRDVYVFGGKHADVPITAASGRTVARTIVTQRVHFVLDVELMRKNERAQFLGDFLEELWQLKKEEDASHPMVLFIDEAQVVAPQKSTSKEVERMREFAADLCREGRNHGIGMVLGAQRSANVDKDLLALVEMLIVMRTIHHLDRKVYKAWVDEKGSKDDDDDAWLHRLRRLNKGDAYLYAPELNVFERVHILMPDTYDATATAKLGERVAKVGKLSKLDVRKLGEELTRVVEETQANDPATLRRRIAELEAKVGRPVAPLKPLPPVKVDKRGLKRLEKAVAAADKVLVRLKAELSAATAGMGSAAEVFAAAAKLLKPGVVIPPGYGIGVARGSATPIRVHGLQPTSSGYRVEAAPVTSKKRTPASSEAAEVKNDGDLKGPPGRGELRILAAIAQHENGATREAITVLAGYKASSRNTYLLKLQAAGYVQMGESDKFVATHKGFDLLGPSFERLPVGSQLRDHWMRTLPFGERKILGTLVGAYPASLSRDTIDAHTGYKASSRNTYLLKLQKRELVYEVGNEMKASSMLFD